MINGLIAAGLIIGAVMLLLVATIVLDYIETGFDNE